jgi:hypothetical protein
MALRVLGCLVGRFWLAFWPSAERVGMVFTIKGEELRNLINIGCDTLPQFTQALISFTAEKVMNELEDHNAAQYETGYGYEEDE